MPAPVRRPDAEPTRATFSAPAAYGATASSTTALAANDRRVSLVITNEASEKCYLAWGSNPAVVGSGMVIPAGGNLFLDRELVSTQALQVILTSGTGNLSIQEGE